MHASSLGADKKKKKKAHKKSFLHYNTKIIITGSNSQILGELLLLQTERN